MSYLISKRLRGPLKVVGGLGTLALLAGWAMYRNNPSGLLQHSHGNACPSVVHSFAAIYWGILAATAIAALVVGIICMVVRDLGILAQLRANVQAIAASCAMVIAGVALLALLAIPLKAFMPLVPSEPCKAITAPNN